MCRGWPLIGVASRASIAQDGQSRDLGQQSLQHFQRFGSPRGKTTDRTCNVAAWPSEGLDHAWESWGSRLGAEQHNDRNRAGRLAGGFCRTRPGCHNDLYRESHQFSHEFRHSFAAALGVLPLDDDVPAIGPAE
jgi:hypothetical protein